MVSMSLAETLLTERATQDPVGKGAEHPRVQEGDRGRDQEQDGEAQRLPFEVRVGNEEISGEDDCRGRGDRLFVGDARHRHPARHTDPLGEQHPAEHVEDATGHVAGEDRLPPGDLRLAGAHPVSEAAQEQVPGERAEREVEQQDDDRRDQPEHVEVDALVLDLRPLADHGQDQEAEDHEHDSELDRQPHLPVARRPGAEPGARLAYPV
jgi:hypothetical protein